MKPIVSLDENVDNSIKQEAFKPRRHPGIMTPKSVQIPEKLTKAIQIAVEGRNGFFAAIFCFACTEVLFLKTTICGTFILIFITSLGL